MGGRAGAAGAERGRLGVVRLTFKSSAAADVDMCLSAFGWPPPTSPRTIFASFAAISARALALTAAQAELERLRATIHTLEAALRTAGKVLAPYVGKLGHR
jgi:hypothetical protein